MPAIFLETPRLILRSLQQSDEAPFIALNNDNEVMEYFPAVLTSAETLAMISRMSDHIAQWGYGFFAVERKDNRELMALQACLTPVLKATLRPVLKLAGV